MLASRRQGGRQAAVCAGPVATTQSCFASPPPALPLAVENHMFGLPPAHYDKWPALRDNFHMLTTSKDR